MGLYEEEAKKKGIEVETYTAKLDEVDRAILDSQEDGFARLHVKKGTDQIVGATVVAAHAGGFPAMTGNVPFLIKDVVMLAASFYLLK